MIPVFKTAAHGTYDQVTRVRLATAALAALLIPLTFILARIVAPQTPWVWGAASVLPAFSRGYTFNLSQVTNDALALLVGAASALVLLWLLRARLNWVWGAVAGVTAGTAVVTKVTVYFVPIFLAIAFLWRARRDWHLASVLSAAATGIGIGAAVAIPWVYFNWRHYHALVGTTPFPPNLVKFHNLPLLDALRVMVTGGSIKFWAGEMVPAAPPPWLLAAGEIGLLVCVAGFLLRPAWRDANRSDQTALLAWALGGRPGIGTVANAVLIGLFIQAFTSIGAVTSLAHHGLELRIPMLAAGIALAGPGSAFYIGADLGAGPRDTLMLVGAQRTGARVGAVRAAIEVSALVGAEHEGVQASGRVGISARLGRAAQDERSKERRRIGKRCYYFGLAEKVNFR